uniref:Uncharacterized protein n=1 Tax=Romanomermis culicivorax TaxID=13658 RepID=A0A915JSI3_ROMCU
MPICLWKQYRQFVLSVIITISRVVWHDPSDYHVADKIIDAECYDKITYFSPNLMEFESVMVKLGNENF